MHTQVDVAIELAHRFRSGDATKAFRDEERVVVTINFSLDKVH